jgi:hypothetical protein
MVHWNQAFGTVAGGCHRGHHGAPLTDDGPTWWGDRRAGAGRPWGGSVVDMNCRPLDALLCGVEEILLAAPGQAVAIAATQVNQVTLELVGEEGKADGVDGGHVW